MEREDKLRVFLEPAEWDEVQGSRPTIQLDVSIKHYIDGNATNNQIAVERSNLPCMSSFPTLSAIFSTHQFRIAGTVLWSVSKSTPDPKVVRENVAGARKRATYPLYLPRGVASGQMEKFWHELQFNPAEPVDVPFKAELFRSPPRTVKFLRHLARKGRWRLEHSIRKQNGRPKHVLGNPNDVREVAPLLALAHGRGRSNLDAVDNTTTTKLSTKLRRQGRKDRPRRSSSMRLAEGFEDQDQTTRKARNPQTAAPTSSHPSQTTVQTTQVHTVPKAKPIAQDTNATGSGNFIPETKSVHSEGMLLEDQR